MRRIKIKSKLPESEAKALFYDIIDYMVWFNIIPNEYGIIGKTNFHVTKHNFKFFFKTYKDALLKIKTTNYFQELIKLFPMFSLIIENSFKAKLNLFSNYKYYDFLKKDLTGLPVDIWLFKNKKRKIYNRYNYQRIIIQTRSDLYSNVSYILTIKLLPNIEIIDNYGYDSTLTNRQLNKVLKWIDMNKKILLRMNTDIKFYNKMENSTNENLQRMFFKIVE